MKYRTIRSLLVVAGLLSLQSCAVVKVPVGVAGQAAKSTIRVTGKTAELGLEVLDEPFEHKKQR